ncbi:MAG: hypothetical protein JHC93_04825 [Parachlamydiales bacterium]|nr:hypothetical protein [Parachlamydiales bacterium]
MANITRVNSTENLHTDQGFAFQVKFTKLNIVDVVIRVYNEKKLPEPVVITNRSVLKTSTLSTYNQRATRSSLFLKFNNENNESFSVPVPYAIVKKIMPLGPRQLIHTINKSSSFRSSTGAIGAIHEVESKNLIDVIDRYFDNEDISKAFVSAVRHDEISKYFEENILDFETYYFFKTPWLEDDNSKTYIGIVESDFKRLKENEQSFEPRMATKKVMTSLDDDSQLIKFFKEIQIERDLLPTYLHKSVIVESVLKEDKFIQVTKFDLDFFPTTMHDYSSSNYKKLHHTYPFIKEWTSQQRDNFRFKCVKSLFIRMAEIHNRDYIHNLIRPENIRIKIDSISQEVKIKITGYSNSCIIGDQDISKVLHNDHYTAPELFEIAKLDSVEEQKMVFKEIKYATDTWSLIITALEFYSGISTLPTIFDKARNDSEDLMTNFPRQSLSNSDEIEGDKVEKFLFQHLKTKPLERGKDSEYVIFFANVADEMLKPKSDNEHTDYYSARRPSFLKQLQGLAHLWRNTKDSKP